MGNIFVPFTQLFEFARQKTSGISNAEDSMRDQQRVENIQFTLILDVGMHVPQTGNQKFAARVEDAGTLWDLQTSYGSHGGDAAAPCDDHRVCHPRTVSNVNDRGTGYGQRRLSLRYAGVNGQNEGEKSG